VSKKFTEYSSLLDNLVGDTSAHGESNADANSLENIDSLQEIGTWVMQRLYRNLRYENNHQGSMRDIYKKSVETIKELLGWFDGVDRIKGDDNA